MKRAIRNLIVGKDVYIESRNEFRQVMLSGYYALMSLLVIAAYIIMELPYGSHQALTIYCIALSYSWRLGFTPPTAALHGQLNTFSNTQYYRISLYFK